MSIASGSSADDRLEIQNVALDIDSERNLAQLEPVGGQAKYATLGHIQHRSPARSSERAAEGDMLHLLHKPFRGSVIEDDHLAIFDCRKLLAGLERADKYHLASSSHYQNPLGKSACATFDLSQSQ